MSLKVGARVKLTSNSFKSMGLQNGHHGVIEAKTSNLIEVIFDGHTGPWPMYTDEIAPLSHLEELAAVAE